MVFVLIMIAALCVLVHILLISYSELKCYLLVHEADVQNWKKIRQVTTPLPQEWIIERLGGGKD